MVALCPLGTAGLFGPVSKEALLFFPRTYLIMREEAKAWLEQAEADFESAKGLLGIKRYYLVALLCQQAVEKGFKAIIIEKKKEQAFSHSLPFLGKEAGVPESKMSFLRRLSPYYIISRYPDSTGAKPFELVDREIAESILKGAEEVMQWIRIQLK